MRRVAKRTPHQGSIAASPRGGSASCRSTSGDLLRARSFPEHRAEGGPAGVRPMGPLQTSQVRGCWGHESAEVGMSNERLRRAVLDAGMTVDDLAAEIGIDPKTLERWITRGRVPHPANRAR